MVVSLIMSLSLELKNVSKSFKNKVIFYQASCLFKVGCYAIIGSNGVGKTVFIEMLAGVLRQDAGLIYLEGIGSSKSCKYKNELAYIPSVPSFFPQATGEEFLNFIYSVKNGKKNLIHVHQLIKDLQLTVHLKTRFNNMSLGTQKKLFLVTLVMNPSKLIIMDEPSNALDDAACQILSELIKKLSQKAIVILATHDQQLLEKIYPNIIKLTSNPTTELQCE
jgi:heme-transporting ATPase